LPKAHRVFALFKNIREGTYTSEDPEIKIKLNEGEYAYLQETLEQNIELRDYVREKLRYYYNEKTCVMIICMPRIEHEGFLRKIDWNIQDQLEAIRSESGTKADFAQELDSWGSAELDFEGIVDKHEPDISFGHDRAKFPGVVIEIGLSQKKKSMNELAEDYLIDSEASIRVVVCVKLPYHPDDKSRKAMLSVWRPQLFDTPDGPRLRAVAKVEDEVFRDDEGNPVDSPGIQLRLSDFTYEELASDELGDEDAYICISGKQLGEYLNMAERNQRGGPRGRHRLDPGTKGEKRPRSPEEERRN